jgi:hypothetical protein
MLSSIKIDMNNRMVLQSKSRFKSTSIYHPTQHISFTIMFFRTALAFLIVAAVHSAAQGVGQGKPPSSSIMNM